MDPLGDVTVGQELRLRVDHEISGTIVAKTPDAVAILDDEGRSWFVPTDAVRIQQDALAGP